MNFLKQLVGTNYGLPIFSCYYKDRFYRYLVPLVYLNIKVITCFRGFLAHKQLFNIWNRKHWEKTP